MEKFTFVSGNDNVNKSQQDNSSKTLAVVEEIRETTDQTERDTFSLLAVAEEIRESVRIIKNIAIIWLALTIIGIVSYIVVFKEMINELLKLVG